MTDRNDGKTGRGARAVGRDVRGLVSQHLLGEFPKRRGELLRQRELLRAVAWEPANTINERTFWYLLDMTEVASRADGGFLRRRTR